jgi:hypothetical protein
LVAKTILCQGWQRKLFNCSLLFFFFPVLQSLSGSFPVT